MLQGSGTDNVAESTVLSTIREPSIATLPTLVSRYNERRKEGNRRSPSVGSVRQGGQEGTARFLGIRRESNYRTAEISMHRSDSS
jgi:hypothetical protein